MSKAKEDFARGRIRLSVGPSSTKAVLTTRLLARSPLLFSALATAERRTLATSAAARVHNLELRFDVERRYIATPTKKYHLYH